MLKNKLVLALAAFAMLLPAGYAQLPDAKLPEGSRILRENRLLRERIAILESRINNNPPMWGNPKLPTVPGEYDYRHQVKTGEWLTGRMAITPVMLRGGLKGVLADDTLQWSGPIPVPVDPTKGGGGIPLQTRLCFSNKVLAEIMAAFNGATKSTGLSDGCVAGLYTVTLDQSTAQRLLGTVATAMNLMIVSPD